MIGWNFRNKNPDAAAASPSAPAAAAPAAAACPATDWSQQLHAARGDDEALLALARSAAPLELRLEAVAAIDGEAALRLAEREFRNHDRRIHRLAKQRWSTCVAQREARAQAKVLIEAARALLGEAQIPVNRLVEIDRDWQAIELALVDAAQRDEYAALLQRLSALTRERADQVRQLQRWTAQAREALAAWQAVAAAVADGTQERATLGGAAARLLAVQQDVPPGAETTAALQASLADTLQTQTALDTRLDLLEALARPSAAVAEAPPPAAAPVDAAVDATVDSTVDATAEATAEAAVDAPADEGADAPATDTTVDDTSAAATEAPPTPAAVASPAPPRPPDAAQRWAALPPLADAALADALERRFAAWQQQREQARTERKAVRREQVQDRQRAVRGERAGALAAAADAAEAALAGGHLAEAHKHLLAIDEMLHGGAPVEAQRTRIERLQAEYAQLKGWQHWAGGRARDDLVLQAEALAAATSAGTTAVGAVKLSLRQRTELIDEMRARWKELDRLGGATSRSLWQRFDAALKAAYQPVAVQLAAQRSAREQNLQARTQLVAELEAVPLPAPDDAGADWRAVASALDHFQTGWRKLGPLEHTVPHAARAALTARRDAAIQRVEAPLAEVRRGARAQRTELIAHAGQLAERAAAGMPGRETVDRVRDLQAEWQRRAKALPLGRADEGALWTEFRAALDAVFAARDRAFKARDAEFQAHGAERTALIGRLEALNADTPPAEIRRTLGEVDAAWQRGGPPPRHQAAAIESRFLRAHDAARELLAGSAQRAWQRQCDALVDKLALCEVLEAQGLPAEAVVERWAALPALLPAWEQVLARRAGLPLAGARGEALPADASPDLLLQLEAAWGLPSPPEFEDARRALKLQAMKAALEGRRAAPAPTPEQWLAAALGRAGLDDAQRARLRAVIGALRRRGPPRS